MKTLLIVAIGIFLLSLSPVKSRAQTDTMIFRQLTTTLNDSTHSNFQYSIGRLVLKNSGGYSAVLFTPTQADTNTVGYLKSSFFTAAGSGDTLSISRDMDFDNSLTPDISQRDTTTSTANTLLTSEWITAEDSKEVHPDITLFSSSSKLKYLIELRKESDGSLIAVLDTLTVSTNGSGNLRYVTCGNTPNRIKVPLSMVSTPTSVYIDVLQTPSYVVTGGMVQKTERYSSNFWGAFDPVECGFRQEGCSGYLVFKKAIAAEPTPGAVDILSLEPISPNPAGSAASLRFVAKAKGTLVIEIADLLGEVVVRQNTEAAIGPNSVSLNLGRLVSGPYFVRVIDGSQIKTVRMIVNH